MNKSSLFALGIGLALAGAAQAQEKKTAPAAAPAKAADKAGEKMAPPAPAPELISAAKFFLGNWKCDGQQAAGPWGPESKYTGKTAFKMDLDGFWLSVNGDMKMATPAVTMKYAGFSGYDPNSKKIMRTDIDSTGGIIHFSSPGWEGDKMVFSGEGMMMGKKLTARHTITKTSETEMASTFEVSGPDGKTLVKMGEETCKKAGKK